MLWTQNAKFAIALIKNRWYKRNANIQNIYTIYDSFGIYEQSIIESTSTTFMNDIWNFRQDCSNQDFEFKHMIAKRQIYGECTALGWKLASLAVEFNLTHVAATLQGLIQQVKQSNTNFIDNQTQDMILNLLQANVKGRPTKRLKSCLENSSKSSKSEDGYTCWSFKEGYNARKCIASCKNCNGNGHIYLHCSNKENITI